MRKRTIGAILLAGIITIVTVISLNWATVRNTLVAVLKKQLREDFLTQASVDNKEKITVSKEIKFSVALVTDVHNNTKGITTAVQQINNSNATLLIGLGDYTNVGTREEFIPIKTSLKRLAMPYFLLPGDHDLWNGRDKDQDPEYYFHSTLGGNPDNFIKEGVQFIFLDNADLYEGISDEDKVKFENDLSTSTQSIIIIASHKAIYHPLTIHRMGYINDSKNDKVAAQAEDILAQIKSKKNAKIILISGDLHNFSRYDIPTDNYEAYSIGALTEYKNFQSPRYAIMNINKDNTVTIKDIPLEK
jgi:predicted phosphodiesterase